jgi:flagellar assembly factor FliW
MPQIETLPFGPLSYSDDAVLEFPAGLPAFEEQTRFVLVERPDEAPVIFLQSLLRPDLTFLTLPAQTVAPNYRFEIPTEDLALLGFPAGGPPPLPGRDVLYLAIVTAPAGSAPTANLMAPIVVNLASRRAAQVIRPDTDYSHQHPLFPPSQESPCS